MSGSDEFPFFSLHFLVYVRQRGIRDIKVWEIGMGLGM